MNCPYCGAPIVQRQTGEPARLSGHHNVTLCELMRLRELRDRLIEWGDDDEHAPFTISSVIHQARELARFGHSSRRDFAP